MKKRILIVDDEIIVCNMLAQWLEEDGYYCDISTSASDAMDLLEQKQYDLMISDIMMPVKTGFDLVEELKKNESFSTIPIILLTAKTDEASIRRGLKTGANAFIGKPFSSVELLSSVDNLLTLKSREKRIEELENERNIN